MYVVVIAGTLKQDSFQKKNNRYVLEIFYQEKEDRHFLFDKN
jgi:hypothetical protein